MDGMDENVGYMIYLYRSELSKPMIVIIWNWRRKKGSVLSVCL